MNISFKTLAFCINFVFFISLCGYAQDTPAKKTSTKKDSKKTEINAADTQGHVFAVIKPGTKSALFKDASKLNYSVKLNNTFSRTQDGKFVYQITTDSGKLIHADTIKVHLAKNAGETYSLKVPCKDPGFYHVTVRFSLPDYKDTLASVFGLNTIRIEAPANKPEDFELFWQSTLEGLRAIDPKFKINEERALAVNNKKVYLIEMHSLDDAVIYGWLTIPNARPKKIPVKIKLPDYLVKSEPDFDDQDFAVFTLDVRGHGISKNAGDTRGEHNLYQIDNRDKYFYRGVYMDCVRSLDFIMANAKMGLDTAKILVEGTGQGGALALVLAGLDKRVKLVGTVAPLYVDFREALFMARQNASLQTPVAHIGQYIKSHARVSADQVLGVWDYFDPLNFAPLVKCPVLLATTLTDPTSPPRCSFALFNKLRNKENMIVVPEKANKFDDVYKAQLNIWVKDYFMML